LKFSSSLLLAAMHVYIWCMFLRYIFKFWVKHFYSYIFAIILILNKIFSFCLFFVFFVFRLIVLPASSISNSFRNKLTRKGSKSDKSRFFPWIDRDNWQEIQVVVFKRISSINYGFQVKICCIRHSSLLAYVFISRKLRIQTEIKVSD
jgi:hypothetical protein